MRATLPILYSFRRCPYAMRARMALSYAKQDVEIREVTLKHKPTSLFDYSPKGTVPVLVLTDDTVIDESIDIMHWALSHNDSDNWLNNINEQRKLIEQNDTDFKTNLDKYKYADRHPEFSEAEYRERCFNFIDDLEKRLSIHQYLFSDQIHMADIAIFPFIRQFAHVDLAWFEGHTWPSVTRWLNELKHSTLFTSIMHKYPTWSEDDIATQLLQRRT